MQNGKDIVSVYSQIGLGLLYYIGYSVKFDLQIYNKYIFLLHVPNIFHAVVLHPKYLRWCWIWWSIWLMSILLWLTNNLKKDFENFILQYTSPGRSCQTVYYDSGGIRWDMRFSMSTCMGSALSVNLEPPLQIREILNNSMFSTDKDFLLLSPGNFKGEIFFSALVLCC